MTKKREPKVVREPMQVYLDAPDREVLDRAADASGLPRSEVLRRGLRRFAAEVLADESPALSFLERAADDSPEGIPADAAERHDEMLADWELKSRDKSADR